MSKFKNNYFVVGLSYVLVFIALNSCSKEDTILSNAEILFRNPLQNQNDSLVHRFMIPYAKKLNSASVSIALIDGNKTDSYFYGETKKGTRILPDSNTLFEIGSVTKTFTSLTLVAFLAENGISLDDPIKANLPQSLNAAVNLNGNEITFRHLLNHTSGFERIPSDLQNPLDPYLGYDSTRLYSYLAARKPLRVPGMKPANETDAYNYYSNTDIHIYKT